MHQGQAGDQAHGVRAAVLEKSTDCVGFARVAEFPSFANSYAEETVFQFDPLNTVPVGVFQIRSRHNISLCFGCEVPVAEQQDVAWGISQKTFPDGGKIELQTCNLNALMQFWYFDGSQRLVNAMDGISMLTIPSAEAQGDPAVPQDPTEGAPVVVKRCDNGCPNLNGAIRYSSNEDGFLKHDTSEIFIVAPEGLKLNDTHIPVTMTACGTTDVGPGELEQCPGKTAAQWDLVPLFTVMDGKKAVNCAPYSHSHPNDLQPTAVNSAHHAQRLCAADATCMVYMYVTAESTDATDAEKGKAWFCTKLDTVYSGKQGYSLGFRALNLDEEEMKKAEEAKEEL